MRTRAAVLHPGADHFTVQEVDLQPPRDGEVLVRIAAAGVCHSDWNLVTGDTPHPRPVVVGHEGAGIVEALGPGVEDLRIGDHVALSWAPACGRCFQCQRRRPALCETNHDRIWAGQLLDGTSRLSLNGQIVHHYCGLSCFADHAVVPRPSCVIMPRDLPFSVAALIGCAVTTGLGAALNTVAIDRGSTVVVTGVGGVGLSIVMGARIAAASRIMTVDRVPHRCAAAMELGATDVVHTGNANTADGEFEWAQSVRRLTSGRGADYAFDTTGDPRVIERCLAAIRPGGTVVLVGLPGATALAQFSPAEVVRQEKSIIGSYYGSGDPQHHFQEYARAYLKGVLPLDRLISGVYPLENINSAYQQTLAGRVLRGVIQMI